MDKLKIKLELLAPECDAKEVLCTGSFDDWITSSGVVRLSKKAPGYFTTEVAWAGKHHQYKYHLGDWQSAELDEWGNTVPNRSYSGEGPIRDFVPQFANEHQFHNPLYLPRIERLPTNLPLPAPFATRRIAALLPYNYENSRERYPVLYLQDGQNLFDEFAPYGNWELDKRLAWLAERGWGDFIVVAIDHAEDKRIKEFSPPNPNRVGQGDADAYGNFLARHLKPLIDRTYRTLTDRSHTAIGGSSMGALASLHVAMSRPANFGSLMMLSPSIWVDETMPSRWPEHNFGATKVFLYGGMQESAGSAATFGRLAQSIKERHNVRRCLHLRSHFSPSGKHVESEWGAVFPRAATYLFS